MIRHLGIRSGCTTVTRSELVSCETCEHRGSCLLAVPNERGERREQTARRSAELERDHATEEELVAEAQKAHCCGCRRELSRVGLASFAKCRGLPQKGSRQLLSPWVEGLGDFPSPG